MDDGTVRVEFRFYTFHGCSYLQNSVLLLRGLGWGGGWEVMEEHLQRERERKNCHTEVVYTDINKCNNINKVI